MCDTRGRQVLNVKERLKIVSVVVDYYLVKGGIKDRISFTNFCIRGREVREIQV